VTSTIPAVLSKLTQVFTAVEASVTPNFTVIDGPAWDPPDNFLAVGWDRSDQPAVIATNASADYGNAEGQEQYDVSCLLSFFYDAAEVTTVRGQMFAAFQQLRAAVAADTRLGETVLSAWISRYELTPILLETGSVMDLRFSVAVNAMT
jgi:hypothetical protein